MKSTLQLNIAYFIRSHYLLLRLFSVFFALTSTLCFADFPETPIILDFQTGACVPTTEICGDGIDQDCNGDDFLCPSPDQDRDGYPTGSDCDDANRHIYPNISVQCSASCGSGTKQCLSNGTYTSCSCAPLCEATGSGTCYYISTMTGDDANNGTFLKPWKTTKNIMGFKCPQGKPAKWTQLSPGDVVYFTSGVYDGVYSFYDEKSLAVYLANITGTATDPVTLKAYPGNHPVIAPSLAHNAAYIPALYVNNSSHLIIDGIEITRSLGSGILIYNSSNIELRNMWIHDITGRSASNVSGVILDSSQNIHIHHSIINDNYDRLQKNINSQNIAIFRGGNIRIMRNVIFQSPQITAQATGGCVAYKHAADTLETSFEVGYNMLWNCAMASIASSTSNSQIHHNLILNSSAISFQHFNRKAIHQNNIAEYNKIIGSKALYYEPTNTYSPIGLTTFRNNTVYDTTDYNSTAGSISICTSCETALFNTLVSSGNLSFSSNAYYNPNHTLKFNLFSTNSEVGGIYDFTGWRNLGFDAGSYVGSAVSNTPILP